MIGSLTALLCACGYITASLPTASARSSKIKKVSGDDGLLWSELAIKNVPSAKPLSIGCSGINDQSSYHFLPVSFTHQVILNDVSNMFFDNEWFEIKLENGDKIHPDCATVKPAAREHERRTILLIIDSQKFEDDSAPTEVKIKTKNLTIDVDGVPHHMKKKKIDVKPFGSAPTMISAAVYDGSFGDCQTIFPDKTITNVVRVLYGAGVFQQQNPDSIPDNEAVNEPIGFHEFESQTELERAQSMFQLLDENENNANLEIIGLGNIADVDNVVDICVGAQLGETTIDGVKNVKMMCMLDDESTHIIRSPIGTRCTDTNNVKEIDE